MLRTIKLGASGLHAYQLMLDTTASNITNINTTGYKGQRLDFADLIYQPLASGGVPVSGNSIKGGSGVKVLTATRCWGEGAIITTGRTLDVAICGLGWFLAVKPPSGRPDEIYYTRNGCLQVDGERYLTDSEGNRLQPELQLPSNWQSVAIDSRGRVTVLDGDGRQVELGRLGLYRFTNPDGLEARGNGLFARTEASGPAREGVPGEDGYPEVVSGALESSSVDLTNEMANLLMAQRSYQICLQALKTADEMWGLANGLRK